MSRSIRHIVAMMIASCVAACGGGGDSGTASGTGATASGAGNGTLSSGRNACAPNLCVDFNYPTANIARALSASVKPHSGSAVVGLGAHYAIVSGALPAGMSLNGDTGEISGTPTQNGSQPCTLQLTVDGYSGSLKTALVMSVADPSLTFTPPNVSVGTAGLSVQGLLQGVPANDATLTLGQSNVGQQIGFITVGAVNQVQYAVTGPVSLPPGLTLNPDTGAITGTPPTPGVWLLAVQATIQTPEGTSTFRGRAAIAVNPVFQESAGQTAAPVQARVYAAPDVVVTPGLTQSVGNPAFAVSWDAPSSTFTFTPGAVPQPYAAGSFPGAFIEMISTSAGDLVPLSYVEVFDSSLVSH